MSAATVLRRETMWLFACLLLGGGLVDVVTTGGPLPGVAGIGLYAFAWWLRRRAEVLDRLPIDVASTWLERRRARRG